MADVGVPATAELVRRLEARGELGDLGAALAEEVASLFGEPPMLHVDGAPSVILVVGVNGTGKTTTIGKLASKLARARPLRRRRGGRHVPRGGRGAARDLGAARRRRLRRLRARRRPGRGRVRRDRGGAGARPRRRDRRHRRPPAHADEPDGGAREGAARDRGQAAGRAARDAARRRRDDGPERRCSRRSSSGRPPASPVLR